MSKKDLQYLAELTNNNNHTEARIYVAEHFGYLGSLKNIFQKINEIHYIEGSLNSHLSEYRNDITAEMFKKLRKNENEGLVDKINACL